jgi:hypothetical protein
MLQQKRREAIEIRTAQEEMLETGEMGAEIC